MQKVNNKKKHGKENAERIRSSGNARMLTFSQHEESFNEASLPHMKQLGLALIKTEVNCFELTHGIHLTHLKLYLHVR